MSLGVSSMPSVNVLRALKLTLSKRDLQKGIVIHLLFYVCSGNHKIGLFVVRVHLQPYTECVPSIYGCIQFSN